MKHLTVAERLAQSCVAAASSMVVNSQVLHAVERVLLDTLACALGGAESAPAKAVRAWARLSQGTPHANIIGTRETSSVHGATLANCTLSRHLDMNDCDWASDPAHPSDNIGACLAVGQVTGASAVDILKAILVAYEVQMRSTEFTKVSFFKTTGWDHTTFVTLATSAAAGTLLHLDAACARGL